MMTPKRRTRLGPLLLVIIGLSVNLAGIGMHWWFEANRQPHTLEWLPQLVGACIAFVGFYGLNRKAAIQGGGFIVGAGTTVLGILRGKEAGRRATDAVVVEHAAPPLDEDDIPPHAGGA